MYVSIKIHLEVEMPIYLIYTLDMEKLRKEKDTWVVNLYYLNHKMGQ